MGSLARIFSKVAQAGEASLSSFPPAIASAMMVWKPYDTVGGNRMPRPFRPGSRKTRKLVGLPSLASSNLSVR